MPRQPACILHSAIPNIGIAAFRRQRRSRPACSVLALAQSIYERIHAAHRTPSVDIQRYRAQLNHSLQELTNIDWKEDFNVPKPAYERPASSQDSLRQRIRRVGQGRKRRQLSEAV